MNYRFRTLCVGFKLIVKKERESLYLLPVPRSEALALPIVVERATRSLTLYDIRA